jgi:rfaE bifunctional protein nucleotidyltransferase chain/domain
VGQVVSQSDLILRCRQRKDNGDRIVFVAGIFDLLHPGHIRLLEQARDHGQVLVAAVLSDSSVGSVLAADSAQQKRPLAKVERPITPAGERAEILAALAAVDYVVELDLDGLPDLLARLRPDAAVERAEPSSPPLLARTAVASGVKLVRIPFEPGHSTAAIIERIVQLSGFE